METQEQFKRILSWQDKHELEDRKIDSENKLTLQEIKIDNATNKEILNEQTALLIEIKNQTIKTNGRVGKLENWRAYILGAMAVVIVVIIPALTWVVQQIISIKIQ